MRKLTLAAALLAFASAACEKTGDNEYEVKTPTVGVQSDTIETPDVDVGTQTDTIAVPDVDVKTEKKEVKTPTVDVN